MLKVLASALMLSALVGCTTAPTGDVVAFYADHTRQTITGHVTEHHAGSGIQWDKDYVVTAKHVVIDPRDGTTSYVCDDGCDLQFVRRSAVVPTMQWRDVVNNEPVSVKGVTLVPQQGTMDMRRTNVAATGVDANMMLHTTINGGTWVRLARMKTTDGMSGGPIYGQDGKIIGMLSGNMLIKRIGHDVYQIDGKKLGSTPDVASADQEGKYEPYAIYMPYEEIQAQWKRFQASIGGVTVPTVAAK